METRCLSRRETAPLNNQDDEERMQIRRIKIGVMGLLPRMPNPTSLLGHDKDQIIVGDENELLLKDMISQLPDHILADILPFLTMKEAGRTSILSHRWRYLWTSYPNLNFDASKILYDLEFDMNNRSPDVEKQLYLNWVNQVIRSYRGPTIDEFTVRFVLDHSHNDVIDEWLHFAFKMNVKRLTLNFFDYDKYYYDCQAGDRYNFPDITATSHQNHHEISSSLTSLKLVRVNITGEVLQSLFIACPLLENLVVQQSTTLFKLEIHTTSLKSLELRFCDKVTNIKVTAPNLVSFYYEGPNTTIQLIKTHKLNELSLAGRFCDHFIANPLEEFSSYLSQLEVIMLETDKFQNIVVPAEFPILASLKRFEFRFSSYDVSVLGFAASILKACPTLCEISFKIYSCRPRHEVWQSEVVVSPHNSLKVVEFVGFRGIGTDVELALYLMKNAVKLEKIIFDTRVPYEIGGPDEFEETYQRKLARKQAKYLVRQLRPGPMPVII